MTRDLVEMARLEYGPTEIIGVVHDSGLVMDSMPKTARLLNLVMGFVNDIPIWGSNGWSPAELHRREMGEGACGAGVSNVRGGKRVFYDERGKPRKIGRNEPCPYGSGMKYKRCCGR